MNTPPVHRGRPNPAKPQQIVRIPFHVGQRVRVHPCTFGPYPNGREGVVARVIGAMTEPGLMRPPIIWRVWLEGCPDWIEAQRCEVVG